MEKAKNKLRILGENRIYNLIMSVLLPVLLFAFSFCRVNKGLEITDTAYNYSNFLFISNLDDMWFFSTFLANVIGRLFTFLPGGKTMLGLNIYTGLIKAGILLLAYLWFTKRVKIHRFLVFLALIMAAGLSWCPTAVLYNYLSYFLLFVGVVLIVEALNKNSDKSSCIMLIIAGLVLGTNIFVRLPNLCEAALIVVVWFDAILKKSSFKKTLVSTFACIGGYIGAILVWTLIACMTRGFDSFVTGITQMLQGGGESSGQYSPLGLIYTAFSGYIGISYWAGMPWLAAVTVVFATIVCGWITSKISNTKLKTAIKALPYICALIMAALCIAYFRITDLYTDFYFEYSSMYGINVIVLLISILCIGFTVFDKTKNDYLRILSVAALVVIFVTPLGSNNGMYSVLNNQYLILPITLYLLANGTQRFGNFDTCPVRLTAAIIVGVGFAHAVLFGMNFSFRDGGLYKMDSEVYNNPVIAHMKTVESNARFLTEATDVWKKECDNSTMLVFGNAAGLSFYLNARPAISTVWPSLASYSYDKYVAEMEKLVLLYENKAVRLPVIVLGQDAVETIEPLYNGEETELADYFGESYIKKLEILYDFLKTYEYSEIYCCNTFKILKPSHN